MPTVRATDKKFKITGAVQIQTGSGHRFILPLDTEMMIKHASRITQSTKHQLSIWKMSQRKAWLFN